MSVIVPRMLEVWVQVTSFVLGVRRGAREAGVSWGFVLWEPLEEEDEDCSPSHQTILLPRHSASWTQEAMLASWSSLLITISSSGPR